jgi:hypothetical protein
MYSEPRLNGLGQIERERKTAFSLDIETFMSILAAQKQTK